MVDQPPPPSAAATPGATTREPELTALVALCRPDGTLAPEAVGWARRPLIDCTLPGRWGRRKRWDFWCVVGPDFVLNLTVADVDYLGLVDVWFRDLVTGEEHTATAPSPLGRGFHLHPRAGEGRVAHRMVTIDDTDPGATTITLRAKGLTADLRVARPAGWESLTVVIPWSDRRFQCTTKDIGRPATGTVTRGGRTYEPRWAALDFGRGKWPYRTTWNWGAGAADDGSVALQLGGKWTDGTGMTENALFVDGRLVAKIGAELEWHYDRADWLAPWRVTGPAVELTFAPIHDKVGRLNAGVAASSTDQCFGTWNGTVAGTAVRDLFGWAEEASWRW